MLFSHALSGNSTPGSPWTLLMSLSRWESQRTVPLQVVLGVLGVGAPGAGRWDVTHIAQKSC